MRPLFPWLQGRLEQSAQIVLQRPVRAAGITFAVLLFPFVIGASAAVFSDRAPSLGLGSLVSIYTVTVGVALWLSLLATGTLILPLPLRRNMVFGIFPLQALIGVFWTFFIGSLVLLGSSRMDWTLLIGEVVGYTIGAVLIAWTALATWAWIRYARGASTD